LALLGNLRILLIGMAKEIIVELSRHAPTWHIIILSGLHAALTDTQFFAFHRNLKRRTIMGDRKSKKDKSKSDKQKTNKLEKQKEEQKNKQPKKSA
jgi:hypothetical protein